jgi:hypothetical protein
VEVFRTIDEKHRVVDIVFLAKFSRKYFGQSGCRGSTQPKIEEFVRRWISSSGQPVLPNQYSRYYH